MLALRDFKYVGVLSGSFWCNVFNTQLRKIGAAENTGQIVVLCFLVLGHIGGSNNTPEIFGFQVGKVIGFDKQPENGITFFKINTYMLTGLNRLLLQEQFYFFYVHFTLFINTGGK